MATSCIVMAAGRGTRLRASLSKMLLPLDGRPLAAHAVGTALRLRGCEVVVVVGHEQEAVRSALRSALPGKPLRFAVQREQRGTGDAVAAGLSRVRVRSGSALILSGDVPLLSARTLGRLRQVRQRRNVPLALLTMELDDPARYGRVIRQGRQVRGVVEYLDANAAQRAVREVNAGIYCVELGFLRREIKRLGADNAKGEVYLTDLVAAAGTGGGAAALRCEPQEVQGVNTWAELAQVAHVLRQAVIARLMTGGVHIVDPARVEIHSSVRVGADTRLAAGVELTGRTRVGAGCRLDTGVILRDCHLGDGVHVKPYSVLEGLRLEPGSVVGPYAHREA
jgi:bifunctional UDP-N-acetylglucosamine pyrophosphorylase/glucosamine-1-phosphate N-acetyltransferase